MCSRLLAYAIVALAIASSGQYSVAQQLSAGSVLVASEKLGDPNFAQSVVLLVQFDSDEGTVGIVVNRRTDIPLSRVFPKTKGATKDPVFMGGPVGITGAQALLRSSEKSDQATRVVEDVYVTGTRDLMEKMVSAQAEPSKFRLYLGYAGWAPGQLEAEIHIGAWNVMNGTAKIIFDRDPDSLWSRLSRESKMEIAGLFSVPHR